MKNSGYFISHKDGLIVAYMEWEDRKDSSKSGYVVKKIYTDEEGFLTLQHKKKRATLLSENALFTDNKKIIKAVFDPNLDSWYSN